MCHPAFRCFFGVVLLGLPMPCLAQPSLPEDYLDLTGTDIKELAKAAFESSQATPRDLVRARLDAAQMQLHERYRKYRADGVDAESDPLLMEAIAFLAEAELATLEKPVPADRVAPLAAHWLYLLSVEQIVEGKYHLGRVSLANVMEYQQARLDTEIKLRRAVAERKLSAPFLIPSIFLDLEEPFLGSEAKEVAKSAFKAGQADLRDLALARTEAARTQLHYYVWLSRIGEADVFQLLLGSAALLVEAELGALENPMPAERLEPLAAYWLFTRAKETLTEAKYNVGRISLADFAQTQHARLDAEIKLRGAVAGKQLSAPFPAISLPFGPEAPLYGPDAKEMAKSAFEAGRADLRDLARARRDAIRTCFQERYEKNRAGAQDATLDLLLKASRQLLEAELGVHDDPAERLAAYERYWESLRIAEEIVRAKYAVGRVNLADYAQAQYSRLDAEIRMREARKKLKEK
ncbi:MAG TPA: hypothetical protein VH575_24110 [Gemmataceae bacterium]|jgi:hypothetical protein